MTKPNRSKSRALDLDVIPILGCILLASAASAIATESGGSTELGEIVVTAQKRAQSLQDVPMSITAISPQVIADAGIRDFEDYAAKVPNLTFSAGFGVIAGRTMAIRGVQGANTTGAYIDDLPVPQSLDPRVMDIARIEVLRGPQGTLYGARSMGGAIRMITQAPDPNDASAQVHLLGASVDSGRTGYQADVSANFPLVADKLALRVTGFDGVDGAFIRRNYPSPSAPSQTLSTFTGRKHFYGGSASALWKATDNLSVRLTGMTQMTTLNGWPLSDNVAGSLVQNRMFNIQENAADQWAMGGVSVTLAQPYGEFTVVANYFNRRSYEIEDASEWNFQVALPTIPLPAPIWSGGPDRRLVGEARFASTWQSPLQLVGGIYYQRARSNSGQYMYVAGSNASTGGFLGTDLEYYGSDPALDDEIAAFGELTYKMSPRWSAIFGVRESHIKTGAFLTWDGWLVAGVPAGGGETVANTFTPKFVLKYDQSDDVNYYALVSKGFRPGTGQAPPPPSFCGADYASSGLTADQLNSYKADSLWNYEVGVKTRSAAKRLTINASAYQINWTDLQQQSRFTCGFVFIVNAGAARSRGTEIEASWMPIDNLQLTAGVGYEDAKITKSSPTLQTKVGAPVQQVAPWTANASIDYSFPLGAWRGKVRTDWNFVDRSFSANEDPVSPRLRRSYTLGNIRLGVEHEQLSVMAFVDNVGNTHANLGDDASEAGEAPDRPRILVNTPRTFGLEATYQFKW